MMRGISDRVMNFGVLKANGTISHTVPNLSGHEDG